MTLWVGDDFGAKVYVYELPGSFGVRDSAKDVAGVTADAFYVTGHGDRLWVGDENASANADHP